jgi:hypothetical protein
MFKYAALSLLMGICFLHATPPAAPLVQSSFLTVYNNAALARQQLTFATQTGTQPHTLSGLPGTLLPESIMLLLTNEPTAESVRDFYVESQDAGKNATLHFTTALTDASLAKGASLIYAFKGLTWQSLYTLKLSPQLDSLSLNCWVEMANQTQASFKNASIQLVDGLAPHIETKEGEAQAATLRAYSLPGSVDIQPDQTKRINWYSKQGLVSTQELRVSVGGEHLRDMEAKIAHLSVDTWLSISNSKEVGLGLPMPRGQAMLYYQDDQGNLELLGKTEINALMEGQELSVRVPATQAEKMGKALISSQSLRNLEVDLDQTEYKKLSDRISEANYRLTIRNKSDKPVVIRATLDLPTCEEWVIVRENIGHLENGPKQISWRIHAQPSGESDLKFRVRIVWNEPLTAPKH